jgi:hypothetical protein
LTVFDDIDKAAIRQQRDIWSLGYPPCEDLRECAAGLIRGVNHASMAVTSLHGEVKLPEFGVLLIFSQIKIHTLRNEPVNNLSTSAYGEPDGRFMAKPCARAQRVVHMRLN